MRSGAVGAALAAAAVVAGLSTSAPHPAAALVEHRAAVVVDTGAGVQTACVRFTEASITGAEALERAGMSPVFSSYGAQGTAVCALCGVGCSSSNCLTCDPQNYWAYYRAAAGSDSYSYSPVGAGATQVVDGSVEGWRWGSGGPPPFFSIEAICTESVSTTTTTTPRPTTTTVSTTAPTASTTVAPGPTSTTEPAAIGSSTTTSADPPTTTSSSSDSTSTSALAPSTTRADSPVAISDTDTGGRSGGSATGLIGFGLVLSAFVALGFWVRRRSPGPRQVD